MAKTYTLSATKLEELKKELEYLKTVREPEVAAALKEARSFGDLSENSEYDEAKNEQGKLYARITEIEGVLANYVIADESARADGEVGIGCVVTLEDVEDGFTEDFTVVGSQEADPMNNRISDDSPLGKAILGKHLGDKVSYEAPMGTVSYIIKAVSK